MGDRYGESCFGFEDLEVYREAQVFQRGMYKVAKGLPPEERYALGQQIRRAAISVTNNIAEGYGRFSWQDMTHFCRQARGSLLELVDDINICAAENYAAPATLGELKEKARNVHRLLNGYLRYLQNNKSQGQ